jgi:hypothetical protein
MKDFDQPPMSLMYFVGRSRGRYTEFLVIRHMLTYSSLPLYGL